MSICTKLQAFVMNGKKYVCFGGDTCASVNKTQKVRFLQQLHVYSSKKYGSILLNNYVYIYIHAKLINTHKNIYMYVDPRRRGFWYERTKSFCYFAIMLWYMPNVALKKILGTIGKPLRQNERCALPYYLCFIWLDKLRNNCAVVSEEFARKKLCILTRSYPQAA